VNISGHWYSELGSRLHLTTDPAGGVSGSYFSTAGHAHGIFPLVGRYDPLVLPERGAEGHRDRAPGPHMTQPGILPVEAQRDLDAIARQLLRGLYVLPPTLTPRNGQFAGPSRRLTPYPGRDGSR
jgi:hypothetical protein